MERKTKHFVQSLAKGLTVLQAFSPDREMLTLTEVAKLADMNAPTAQRFTDTLVELGYLKRNRRKEFYLGPKVLTLGFAYLHGSQLSKVASRFLDEFFAKHHWTTNLGVLEGGQVMYLARREQQRFLKYDVQPGLRLPLNCAAMGKILGAALFEDELDRALEQGGMVRMTKFTIVDPNQFKAELESVRKQGYARAHRELSLDVSAVAVPVLDHEGRVTAAVNVALPADEAKGKLLADAIEAVIDLGWELSASLGYQGEFPIITRVV